MTNYVLREKLKWRSRRSMLELDLYFSKFIESGKFSQLTDDELQTYSDILELEDSYLLALFQGKEYLDQELMQQIINKIKISDA